MRLCEELQTGAEVEVDLENDVLTDLASGRTFQLKPLGEVQCLATICVSAFPCTLPRMRTELSEAGASSVAS